jgi:hypothetical protein
MLRTFFNRPFLMAFLMLIALVTFLFLRFDGFQKRHIVIPTLYVEVDFREESTRLAFERESVDWLQTSGYELANKGWREVTGKAAASQGTGVREDLQVYVKRVSSRSYQVWGIGPATSGFKFVQVYRAMVVSEWTQEKADMYRDLFDKDAARLKNLMNLGRVL